MFRRDFLKRLSVGAALLPMGFAPPSWPPEGPLDDEDFWKLVRAQFPLTTERTYFNAGGLGPAPYPVLDAMQRTMMNLQTRSEAGHRLIEEAREPVARFFGVEPTEIAFLRNATEGNSTIASGLDLRAGDEVIFESHAHPGGSIPWLSRQKQQGIVVKVFEPDADSAEVNLQRIADLITPRTRVLQISHVTAPTGIRFAAAGMARFAHERGLWFHIDGAQSAGMFPVDLKALGCDSYATSGHKWMGAPHGTGLLYIRLDRLDEVAPTEVGAYSDASFRLPDALEYHPTARRYECGTRDAARVVGFAAAVTFLEQIGIERIGAYGQRLARHLQDRLRDIRRVTVLTPADSARAGSIITFKTDGVPFGELNAFFSKEFKLRCRVVSEQGLDAVRVSTHLYNNLAECDRVVEATLAALEAIRR